MSLSSEMQDLADNLVEQTTNAIYDALRDSDAGTDPDLESDLGNAVDELRAIWYELSNIGSTDLEDVQAQVEGHANELDSIITTLSDHYMRM